MVVGFIGVTFVLIQIVNLIFRRLERKNNAAHLRFSRSVIKVFIIVMTIYALAQQFDMTKDMSTALLQSGSLVIAVATFAAQQALSNVISGFILAFSKPYNVNDKIRVSQGNSVIAEGIVTDITLRHTIINQYNEESCIVPNSVMDSAVITNTNYTENIGNFMEITVGYDSDIPKAMELMKRICAGNMLTLNTMENKVFVKGYSADGVILKTTVWTKNLNDSFQACSEIRLALVQEYLNHGIEIPYQTVTVKSREAGEGGESRNNKGFDEERASEQENQI
ncbi:MAG: mechanosensitive ion channel family protein [Lachnospiraceae bacterium]|nr:mechanosensitive ion channel family protein [Lachnospiraceae bacterium]